MSERPWARGMIAGLAGTLAITASQMIEMQLTNRSSSSAPIKQDKRSPQLTEFSQQPGKVFKASIWGMSFPWTLVVSTLLGA